MRDPREIEAILRAKNVGKRRAVAEPKQQNKKAKIAKPAVIERPSQALLAQFDALAGHEPKARHTAVLKITTLYGRQASIRTYVLQRAVRSLLSANLCARLGYTALLTHLLHVDDTATIDSLFTMLKKAIISEEQKGRPSAMIAKVLLATAIVECARMFTDMSARVGLLTRLWTMQEEHIFIAEAVVPVVVRLCAAGDGVTAEEFEKHILPVIKASLDVTPVEMTSAHLWLAVRLFEKYQAHIEPLQCMTPLQSRKTLKAHVNGYRALVNAKSAVDHPLGVAFVIHLLAHSKSSVIECLYEQVFAVPDDCPPRLFVRHLQYAETMLVKATDKAWAVTLVATETFFTRALAVVNKSDVCGIALRAFVGDLVDALKHVPKDVVNTIYPLVPVDWDTVTGTTLQDHLLAHVDGTLLDERVKSTMKAFKKGDIDRALLHTCTRIVANPGATAAHLVPIVTVLLKTAMTSPPAMKTLSTCVQLGAHLSLSLTPGRSNVRLRPPVVHALVDALVLNDEVQWKKLGLMNARMTLSSLMEEREKECSTMFASLLSALVVALVQQDSLAAQLSTRIADLCTCVDVYLSGNADSSTEGDSAPHWADVTADTIVELLLSTTDDTMEEDDDDSVDEDMEDEDDDVEGEDGESDDSEENVESDKENESESEEEEESDSEDEEGEEKETLDSALDAAFAKKEDDGNASDSSGVSDDTMMKHDAALAHAVQAMTKTKKSKNEGRERTRLVDALLVILDASPRATIVYTIISTLVTLAADHSSDANTVHKCVGVLSLAAKTTVVDDETKAESASALMASLLSRENVTNAQLQMVVGECVNALIRDPELSLSSEWRTALLAYLAGDKAYKHTPTTVFHVPIERSTSLTMKALPELLAVALSSDAGRPYHRALAVDWLSLYARRAHLATVGESKTATKAWNKVMAQLNDKVPTMLSTENALGDRVLALLLNLLARLAALKDVLPTPLDSATIIPALGPLCHASHWTARPTTISTLQRICRKHPAKMCSALVTALK